MSYLRVVPLASLLAAGASCTALLGDFSSSTGSAGDGGPQSDASLDGTTSDAADAGESGPGDSGGGEGGQGEAGGGDGGKDGAPPFSCALALGQQRLVTGGDGGTISADNLYAYHASQTNVLALAKTSSAPDLAYWFRSDRPGDAPQAVQLQGSGPARLMSAARSADDTATYVLASDSQNNILLYDWLDSMGIGAGPISTRATTISYQASKMLPTTTGILFASAIQNQGVFVDYEIPAAAPQYFPNTEISTYIDTGLTDGTRTYRLSDDSVSLLYYGSDMTLHQNHYAAGTGALSTSRQFFAGQMLPLSFQADGTNVDIAVVMATDDAGTTYGFFTGVVPESQLFTFDPTTALKPVQAIAVGGPNGCFASYPGAIVALLPNTSGMDLYVVDAATATVTYSLVGASNILPMDTAIAGCGMGTASVTSTEIDFDVIWTENVGSGAQNLFYAPLDCKP
jgi:hypothetical protein